MHGRKSCAILLVEYEPLTYSGHLGFEVVAGKECLRVPGMDCDQLEDTPSHYGEATTEQPDVVSAVVYGVPPSVVRIRLLGRFQVAVGERLVRDGEWRLRKAKTLVKLLALAPGHQLHREQVMDTLWPDADPIAASASLRQALHAARRALDPEAIAPDQLRTRGHHILLSSRQPPRIDAEEFGAAAVSARTSREPAVYRRALRLYTGELLPEDRYEPWLEGRRAELHRLYLGLLLDLSRLYTERCELDSAEEALRWLVGSEPTHEEAHAELMRLYALRGWRYQGIRQYEQLERTLARELGAKPDEATRRLYEDLLRDHLPTARQPRLKVSSNSPPQRNTNLPNSLTSFVGREWESTQVERLLAGARLLTLKGVGGSGKTRLALEVARGLIGEFADGVWLVELAALRDPALVPRTVLATLGGKERPDRSPIETLVETLRRKHLLLVLDNCERLVEACAQLSGELLARCPHLRVLATSRELLNVPAEMSWRVPSLSLPDADAGRSLDELSNSEAVRLFVDRVSHRDPDFRLTSENAAAVKEICARLDGIPLALELAAGRVGVLSLEQIAARLDDSLGLLAGGTPAVPRQQTLRATLDWSYDLLSGPEREMLGRFSVFAGGWSLEAAEAVCAEGAGRVLDGLARLVEKSLVAVDTEARGGPRYRMLEPVRQYAHEQLELAGDILAARHRHAAFFLALAEQAEEELHGPRQGDWLDRLATEHDNLRAALAWSFGGHDSALGLRLSTSMWLFWYTRGYLSEGRAWLERGIASNGEDATELRAKALDGAGWIAMFQGEYEAAKGLLERGLALYRRLGDEDGIVTIITNLSLVAMLGQRRDIPAPSLLEEAMRLRPHLTNRRTIANLLIASGLAAFGQNDTERAWALHEESLTICRETSNTRSTCVCLTNLGLMALGRAEYGLAASLLEEDLRLARGSDDKLSIQHALFGLGSVAAARAQPARAALLWGASEAVREATGIHLTELARSGTKYGDHLSSARAQLGDAPLGRAWAEGKVMAQDRAVEYALEGSERTPSTTLPDGPLGVLTPLLTRRELEVARLVARKLTNRRIAEELVLSERTVDAHVASILRKLGVRSRAQLTDRSFEQGHGADTP